MFKPQTSRYYLPQGRHRPRSLGCDEVRSGVEGHGDPGNRIGGLGRELGAGATYPEGNPHQRYPGGAFWSPTVRPGKPAASKYRVAPTIWYCRTVRRPIADGSDCRVLVTWRTDAPPGVASVITRPTSWPLAGSWRPRIRPIVSPMSALLTGASSTKPALKSGPIAAMKFIVSARLKLPCMP